MTRAILGAEKYFSISNSSVMLETSARNTDLLRFSTRNLYRDGESILTDIPLAGKRNEFHEFIN